MRYLILNRRIIKNPSLSTITRKKKRIDWLRKRRSELEVQRDEGSITGAEFAAAYSTVCREAWGLSKQIEGGIV